MQNIDSIPISTDKRCYTVAEPWKRLSAAENRSVPLV